MGKNRDKTESIENSNEPKYNEQQRRDMVIDLFRKGLKRVEIVKMLTMSYATVQGIISRYLKYGTVDRKKRTKLITEIAYTDLEFLEECIKNESSLTSMQLANMLYKKTGKKVSAYAISSSLRNIGYFYTSPN
ncbi:hypothetical protein NEPAR04_1932 [Nematocida parisii]|nr:hypothetical protein NEPAR08_1516 [Nematocida parisii]KAI5130169.1 hypothetical protein NEPAR03_1990 [Nematocida parisii]KAI5143736.1 hypothetical protein NEPAR04_1932 [Nematocida parisii]